MDIWSLASFLLGLLFCVVIFCLIIYLLFMAYIGLIGIWQYFKGGG